MIRDVRGHVYKLKAGLERIEKDALQRISGEWTRDDRQRGFQPNLPFYVERLSRLRCPSVTGGDVSVCISSFLFCSRQPDPARENTK